MGGAVYEDQKEKVIEMKAICRDYTAGDNVIKALKEVELTITKGEFIGIMGPSASGKSTLLNIIGCLDSPTSGQYQLLGKNIASYKEKEKATVRNQTFGFVFQSFYLLPELDITANVTLPLKYGNITRNMWSKRAEEVLSSVGLEGIGTRYPDQLSGGQQQRVAIARALINKPDILLADEPTGNLDLATGQSIMEELKRLGKIFGTTVIVVTHDSRIAGYADRLIRVEDGRIVEDLVMGKIAESALNSPFEFFNEEDGYEDVL